MKKLLLLLLIVGCDELGIDTDSIGDISEWICTTDYIFPTMAVPDSIYANEDIFMKPDTVLFFENMIYNSLDECASVCPNTPLEVTTIYSPDGTGEYFTMYCSGNN